MKGLLYKEFTLAKIDLFAVAFMQLVTSAVAIGFAFFCKEAMPPGNRFVLAVCVSLCYWLSFAIFGMIDEVFFRQDENRPWGYFVSALPQTAKGQVTCKYYVILIVNLVILFCCFITDLIVVGITGDISNSTIMVGVIIFGFQLIVSAINIPFMIRFGSSSGMYVKGIALAGIVLIVGMYLLFGDISFLLKGNIAETIFAFVKSKDVMWIVAIISCIAVILYYLSYRISLKLYQKGAENYEQ